MDIVLDDLKSEAIAAFLEEHLQEMRRISPPESCHALNVAELQQPDILFWSIWQDGKPVATGALKHLGQGQAEIKSMRVSESARGQGLGQRMLVHILEYAQAEALTELVLETGSQEPFKPAQALYEKYGFESCPPFGSYRVDPNSLYMRKRLPTSPQ